MKSKMKTTKSRLKNDDYHHGSLREALIDTAIKMLKTTSIEDLSLRELARHVGVSQAAPYRHFEDKNELLAAISQQGFELKLRYMLEAIEEFKHDPKELFFQCGLAYFKMGRLHPRHYHLMTSSQVLPCGDHPGLQQAASTTFRLLTDVVTLCQKAGVLGDGDPHKLALHCWVIVNGFTALYVEQRLTWIGVSAENAETMLRGLMCQFIEGAKNPLFPAGPNLFATAESVHNLAVLNQMPPTFT